jgi:hypothetical protein
MNFQVFVWVRMIAHVAQWTIRKDVNRSQNDLFLSSAREFSINTPNTKAVMMAKQIHLTKKFQLIPA